MARPAGTAGDRAAGALLGLACGDAIGTTVEFRRPETFAPVTDMVGGGPFGLRPGEWTDDTAMALCLAESLLDRGAMDLSDQLRRYVLWWRNGYFSSTGTCFDIGISTSSQLARFERTGEPIDPHPDPEAAANGSLMRLAPVAIRWHADPAEAAEMAAQSSRSTHPAPRPVDACRVLGAMTAALIAGSPAGEVLGLAFWSGGPLDPEIERVIEGSWQRRQPPEIRGTGYCVDALEAALWAVGGADDFADAVLRAANLGNDADTTAAIAGQLAGARWGASGIPVGWRAKLALAPRITELATGLYRAGGGEAPVSPWEHDDEIHAWWVTSGRLLAGEYAGDRDPARAAAKVNLLVDAGVRTFLDLTTAADGLAPYAPAVAHAAVVRGLDLIHRNVPIPDLGVVDDVTFDRLVELACGAGHGDGVVYVHCWGGVGRTGTVAGGVLATEGLGYDEILARLGELRAGTRKAGRPCPETPAQYDVLRRRAAAR